jgi:putative aldouronate transport system permease protein
MKSVRYRYRLKLLVIALPIVCLVFVFNYLPLFGWSFAFVDYNPGISILKQNFVGFKYFHMLLFSGDEFLHVMRNTLAMSFLIILTLPIPVIFAIMLSQIKNKIFTRFVQTMASLPYFVSFILVYALAFAIFSGEDGILNIALVKMSLISEPTNILGNEGAAWFFQTGIYLFKNLGYSAIIYIAAIAGIDPELYDAADVDGASRLQKIRHIMIPGISETFFVLLLLSIANMLSGSGFEQYYVFQNPLVIDKLEVLDTYTYKTGLTLNEYSYATAVGIFKTIVSICLLMFANLLAKKVLKRSII